MLRSFLPKCATFSAFFPCRKAPTALQRGPRCVTTAAPLHDNKHAFADQRGPYGSDDGEILNDESDFPTGLQRFYTNFRALRIVNFNNLFLTYPLYKQNTTNIFSDQKYRPNKKNSRHNNIVATAVVMSFRCMLYAVPQNVRYHILAFTLCHQSFFASAVAFLAAGFFAAGFFAADFFAVAFDFSSAASSFSSLVFRRMISLSFISISSP